MNGLVADLMGNLHGIASSGGANGFGAAFELSPSGSDWAERVTYSFLSKEGCSSGPAGLTVDSAGNIFGIGCETIFELLPNGDGGWNSTAVYTFPGYSKDGVDPSGTLAIDDTGNLYGTTKVGGANNLGTVYKLIHGKDGWQEKRLYSFKGSAKDGNQPSAGVVFDAVGNIYGTTTAGGYKRGRLSFGVVYELVAPAGKGGYKEEVLWSFNVADGANPYDALMLDNSGNLYGTTSERGSNSVGVLFELTP